MFERQDTEVLTQHCNRYPGSTVDAPASVQTQSSVNPNIVKSGSFSS